MKIRYDLGLLPDSSRNKLYQTEISRLIASGFTLEDLILKTPDFSIGELIHAPARRRSVLVDVPRAGKFANFDNIKFDNIKRFSISFPPFAFLKFPVGVHGHWHRGGTAMLLLLQTSEDEYVPFYLPNVNFWGCVCFPATMSNTTSALEMIDYFWQSIFNNEFIFGSLIATIRCGNDRYELPANNMSELSLMSDDYKLDWEFPPKFRPFLFPKNFPAYQDSTHPFAIFTKSYNLRPLATPENIRGRRMALQCRAAIRKILHEAP